MLILRSFGKFYGLAGLRLGFAIGNATDTALAAMSGPWPVSGAAIAIGCRALRDDAWAKATSARLARDCVRLDAMAQAQGWRLVGGTPLFRLYETPDALAAQEKLARHPDMVACVRAEADDGCASGLPAAKPNGRVLPRH
ncbi:MAG: aminotransferase class I/II-fold pyridoxal phosphate-dependent enzyme [Aquabacterium sp.]